MTADERERIREDLFELTADVLVLSADFNAHLTAENGWPQDQHAALLDRVQALLEPLSPEARAWVLRKLGERLECK